MNINLNQHKHKNFRRLIQATLMERCERNSQYSLRALAHSFGINHTTLSRLLSGQRNFTEDMIKKIGGALGLGPVELANYSEGANRATSRAVSDSQSQDLKAKYDELTVDTFNVISEWYHDAIAEMTRLSNFQPDAKLIARRLGITVNEVNMAVERMERLGLLLIKDGTWKDLSENNTTSLDPDFTTSALRKYQTKVLELSRSALESVAKSEREHVSNMVAIQKADLAEVKNKINKFRWELTSYLQRAENKPDEVYQLAISFYPVTKSEIK